MTRETDANLASTSSTSSPHATWSTRDTDCSASIRASDSEMSAGAMRAVVSITASRARQFHPCESAGLRADCAGELRQHAPQRAAGDHDTLVLWLLDAP